MRSTVTLLPLVVAGNCKNKPGARILSKPVLGQKVMVCAAATVAHATRCSVFGPEMYCKAALPSLTPRAGAPSQRLSPSVLLKRRGCC